MAKQKKLTKADWRNLAHQQWHDSGSIEVDDNAKVSVSEDGGAYVQAWVWVRNPNAEDND